MDVRSLPTDVGMIDLFASDAEVTSILIYFDGLALHVFHMEVPPF